MKRKLSVLISAILLLLFVSGCSSTKEVSRVSLLAGQNQSKPLLVDFSGQLYQPDNSALSNVTVELTYPDKTTISATTSAEGKFVFDDLLAAQDIQLQVRDNAGTELYSSILSLWPGYDLAYHNTSTTISLDVPNNTLSVYVVCKISQQGKLICSALTSETAPEESNDASPSSSNAPEDKEAASQTLWAAGDNVKLRAKPSTDSQILATLPKGALVVSKGQQKEVNGYTWVRVTYTASGSNPLTGYIRSDLLSETAP